MRVEDCGLEDVFVLLYNGQHITYVLNKQNVNDLA